MPRYALTIEYDGGPFVGWQRQAEGESVQGVLEDVLARFEGAPVVAYGAGGALETVIEGQSGIFFSAQTTDSLMEAMGRFERAVFDPARVRATVERFDVGAFVAAMREFVTVDSASR